MTSISQGEPMISKDLYNWLKPLGSFQELPDKTYLFQQGVPGEDVYLIKSGYIRMGSHFDNNQEVTLRICRRGSLIGESILFSDKDEPYSLNAWTMSPAEVYAINKNDLESAFLNDHTLAFELMKFASKNIRLFQFKIRDIMVSGKKGALYSTLIRLANSYGVSSREGILIDFYLTDSTLASFTASARESANRMLKDLRKRDVVTKSKSGKMIIKDLQYLKDEIQCENCPLTICHIE